MTQRPIKFRAWSKTTNSFVECSPESVSLVRGQFVKHSDIEVQQFTGLLDKNGKEVYEGDIFSVAKEEPRAGVFEVSWKDGAFRKVWHIQGERREELLYPIDERVEIEIIGNIYENPELLKA